MNKTKHKKCDDCRHIKSHDQFHNNKAFKDGKNYICKTCANLKRKRLYYKSTPERLKRIEENKNKKWGDNILKRCPRCKETKSINQFNKANKSKDGHAWVCKECDRCIANAYYHRTKHARKEINAASSKRWKKNNPDKARAIRNRSWNKHIEKRRAQKRERYKRPEIRARRAAYHARNKEHENARSRKWKLLHPDKVKLHNIIRRDKKILLNEQFSTLDIQATLNRFGKKCVKCGSTKNLTNDHFRPLSKGHALSPNNAIILCQSCNSSKCNKDPEEFFTKRELRYIVRILSSVR